MQILFFFSSFTFVCSLLLFSSPACSRTKYPNYFLTSLVCLTQYFFWGLPVLLYHCYRWYTNFFFFCFLFGSGRFSFFFFLHVERARREGLALVYLLLTSSSNPIIPLLPRNTKPGERGNQPSSVNEYKRRARYH
ncbi:hypothetical protein B0T26DRAFT_167469 [Lasiosphaeria miniovina]|uniref:Uncharacterized protein n=1 Tax=Lasiosphaeria miniovina TaxID=1954250 RepID=A0AA40B612_9PEZI|nr:uncharacterized protein B0T26DRAFT_167469 [Lasiosphaeria miniovina]KAK0728350.1 hypothetical protein B0T26DRAFT_167469 [Lasiosphaeria miniovina]